MSTSRPLRWPRITYREALLGVVRDMDADFTEEALRAKKDEGLFSTLLAAVGGENRLNRTQREFADMADLQIHLSEGGFGLLFVNRRIGQIRRAIRAFSRNGLPEMSRLLEEAIRRASPRLHLVRRVRRHLDNDAYGRFIQEARLESLDARFDRLFDRYRACCVRFARANLADFVQG